MNIVIGNCTLYGIKTIFTDFDSTLGIWSSRADAKFKNNEHKYSSILMHPDRNIFDGRCFPNKALQKFFKELEEQVHCYILSTDDSSLVKEPKLYFGNLHFDNIFQDAIITCSDEEKIVVMQAYCNANALEKHEVLYIDDKASTLKLAQSRGFRILQTQEIMNAYL